MQDALMRGLRNSNFNTSATGKISEALLDAPIAVAILEGEDFILTYGNYALLKFWGKAEDIVGKSLLEILPELKDQPFLKILADVLSTGKTYTAKAAEALLEINGKTEIVYCDYSYTVIKNDDGENFAILVTAVDVTGQVLADQKAAEEEKNLKSTIAQVPVAMSLLVGPEFEIYMANVKALELWGKSDEVIGEKIGVVFPELIEQGILDILHNVFETGVPFLAKETAVKLMRFGELEEFYLDFAYQPILDNGKVKAITAIAYDVTKQVEYRKRLEESKLNLEFILQAGQMGYFESDISSGAIRASAQFRNNLGVNQNAEFSKEIFFDLILPEYHDYIRQEEKRAIEEGTAYKLLYKVKRADEQLRWIKSTNNIRYSTDGKPTTIFGVIQDITEEMESVEKQARLAAIVDSTDNTILSKTLQGIITSWNPAAHKMFGYTEDEAIGKHISLLIPDERLAEEEQIINSISQGLRVDHFETQRKTKDGRLIDISLTVSPIRDRTGEIIGASKIARDITEHRLAQEKQAILAAIVDSTEDTILSKTLAGIITSWNPAAERMFGYTEQEAVGKHISMLIPEDRLAEEEYIIGNISKGIRVEHFETKRKNKDGRLIDIALTISPIRNKNGEIIGASKIARDITERKQNQVRLDSYGVSLEVINRLCRSISEELDLEKLLQKVTDSATEVTEADFGAFFYNTINNQGEAYMLYNVSGTPLEHFSKFGMPRNTAVFHPTFAGESIVRVDDITADPRYGKSAPHFGMPKGHLPVKSYLAVPVVSKSGAVVGGLFLGHSEVGRFTQDHENIIVAIAAQAAIAIDNARLFEEVKLLNAKKDEFIGLASHELKTPLTSMTGYLQILDRTPLQENQKGFLKKTIYQTQKLSSLVNDILDVSKIVAGKLHFSSSQFDITQVLLECVELLQLSGPAHKISLLNPPTEITVSGDRHRIEQVVINLLTNATKYSPKADSVDILVEEEGEQVKIGIRDYGIGIPKEKIRDIFSRFYRVDNINPNISGLGIGLYITKEIIDRSEGKIWVESKVGEGSTFWFTLPKSKKHPVG